MALEVTAPFDYNRRFPEVGLYVHLDNTQIDTWVSQLLQSLDLPDRAIERGVVKDFDHNDAKRSNNMTFNELHRALMTIKPENMTEYGVYYRATFDNANHIVWNKAAP